jgi:hypothetical protein
MAGSVALAANQELSKSGKRDQLWRGVHCMAVEKGNEEGRMNI